MDAATYNLSKERIRKLKVDNYRTSHAVVLINLVMLAATVLLFTADSTLLHVAGIVMLALQMMHAYLIVHECGHGTFYKKSFHNDICGHFFAFFALMPFYSRRYEHATHHREAGSFHEPSTRRAMNRFKLIDPKMAAFITVCWKLWVPIFALNEHVMLWGLPFQEGMDIKTRKSAIHTIWAYIAAGSALVVFSGQGIYAILALLPSIYLYLVLIEFFNLPHHLTSPVEDIHGAVPFYEQAKYTRSCAPMAEPFGSWFALNFNYHVAHHLYPAVHWSKVPEAHTIMLEYDPSLGEGMEHEFKINHTMRKKSIREALSKYFDQQYKEDIALSA